MRRISLFLVGLGLLVSCGPSKKPDEPQTVQMKDQVRESVLEAEREAVPPAPAVQETEEELAVEIVDLDLGEPVRTESGVTIRLTSGPPDYRVEFSRNGETRVAEHSGEPLYIEGVAFGNLFTISKFGDAVQATLRSDAPRAPLPEQTALDIARAEKKSQLGCEGAQEEAYLDRNGTAVLRVLDASGKETCRIVVGLYTGRVVDL